MSYSRSRLPIIALAATLLALRPIAAGAGATITTLSFGNIIADPSGDQITIDASAGGPALPHKSPDGKSIVSGGHNGLITISISPEDLDGDIQLILTFESDNLGLICGGKTLSVTDFSSLSQTYKAISTPGDVEFAIGGRLHILSGQSSGTCYSEDPIKVTINHQ